MKGRVLIIAGSDSGGGAGVQADIKAVGAMGAYAATAVTAITVQDTKAVYAVHEVPSPIIRDQIKTVLADIGADAIKIGMIGSVEAGRAIVDGLEAAPDIPVVLDPVLVATSGDSLGGSDVAAFLKDEMVTRASVVTPNLPELAALTGMDVSAAGGIEAASQALLGLGAQAVMAKGGHGTEEILTDYLIEASGRLHAFRNPRLATISTHGTGCTLASALAAGIAQGLALEEAAERAIAYVQAAIKAAPGLGHGHGPLNHLVRAPYSD